jgi:hypothetical protein
LVLGDVVLKLGPSDGAAVLEARDGVLREKLVDEARQDLVRYQARVLAVADDDAGDTLAAAVYVEGVRCRSFVSFLRASPWEWRTLLFYVLSLAGPRPLGDGLARECHKLGIAAAPVSRSPARCRWVERTCSW